MPEPTLIDLYRNAFTQRARPDAFRHKVGGAYVPVSSEAALDLVEKRAAALIDSGVRPGDRVAILAETSLDWALLDLAILTAGAVTVPIYPSLPAAQIEPLLADSEASLIACSRPAQLDKVTSLWARLPALRLVLLFQGTLPSRPLPGRVISLAEFEASGTRRLEREPRSVDERAASVTEEHLASIIYTSGTTGIPKGVMLTHRNFVSNVVDSLQAFVLHADDTTLSHLPLSHVFERMAGLFAPVHVGASIAYAESFDTLAANLLEVRPTVVMSVPRFYEKVLERARSTAHDAGPLARMLFAWSSGVGIAWSRARMAGKRPSGLSRLLADRLVLHRLRERTGGRIRFFISGGAPLEPTVAHLFHAAGLPMYEGYGLTETSPVIAVNTEEHWKIGTVGWPIPGIEVHIESDGEIVVRGANVMKGYYRKPEETAAVLDAEGWFHTGDTGAFDSDGFLRVTGRKKELIVNAGGKKVAPLALEHMLKSIPAISEAVVLGDRKPYLVALLVPDFTALEALAQREGAPAGSHAELARDPRVHAAIEREIEARSGELASFEKIRKFALLDRELSLADGEITPTLKVKRARVQERFADLIEELYQH